MLCQLAKSFPDHVARLLERDRSLKRNFREETVTDLMMASLVALSPFGIHVDYPDERKTGADMDWIFAAPRETNGGGICESSCKRNGRARPRARNDGRIGIWTMETRLESRRKRC